MALAHFYGPSNFTCDDCKKPKKSTKLVEYNNEVFIICDQCYTIKIRKQKIEKLNLIEISKS